MEYLYEIILCLSFPFVFVLSQIGLPDRKLKTEDAEKIREKILIGDVLLTKRFCELSNIFNPNRMKHAALYLGNIEGKDYVIEATTHGVVLTRLNDFVVANDIVEVYSPIYQVEEIKRNKAEIIKNFLGRKYDFKFSEKDEKMYCFELVGVVYSLYASYIELQKTKVYGNKFIYSAKTFSASKYFELVYSSTKKG